MIRKVEIFYPVDLYIGCDVTEDEYESIFHDGEWKKVKEENEGYDGMVLSAKHLVLIWYASEFEFGTIIHECYHAGNVIWKGIGAQHDLDNDEPFAYLLSFLAEESRKLLAERFANERQNL